MKSRKLKTKSLYNKYRLQIVLAFVLFSVFCSINASGSEWPGVDETVVEQYAKEHGREARDPFINTDQGDLLLFVFLLAGSIGGFIAGYYWRIMLEKAPKISKGNQEITD